MSNQEVCPFCGAKKCIYQQSPAYIDYQCATSKYIYDGSFTRSGECYESQIAQLEAKIAKLERVKEAASGTVRRWDPKKEKNFLNLKQALADLEAKDEK